VNGGILNDELQEWRRKRVEKDIYDKFFMKLKESKSGKRTLLPNADSNGPILDFAITGFAKCGTTGMMRTLSAVTTMPSQTDICTPVLNAVHYSYNNWAKEYGKGVYNFTEDKPLKGTKCPYWVEGKDIHDLGEMLPKTNLIVGIRHPVMFFQSFSNQLRKHSTKSVTLEDFINKKRLSKNGTDNHKCPQKMSHCVARSRFHLSLASLGKTLLGPEEQDLLTSELHQSKRRMNVTLAGLHGYPIPQNTNSSSNFGVPNNVFLFDSNQGKKEYLYQELAQFVKIDRGRLPAIDEVYSTTWSGNGLEKESDTNFVFDICLPQWEHVRKELLPISYTFGKWLLDYFIPASYQRDDVTIPNATAFVEIVQTYLQDPCNNTLVRNETDGEYYRRPSQVAYL